MDISEKVKVNYASDKKLAKEHLFWTCYKWEGNLYLSLNAVDDGVTAKLSDSHRFYVNDFFRDGPVYIKLAPGYTLSKKMRTRHKIRLVEDKPLDPQAIIELASLTGAEPNVMHDKWDAVVYLLSYRFSNEELLAMGLDSYYLVNEYGDITHGGWPDDDPLI